jgi:hypothetical protein
MLVCRCRRWDERATATAAAARFAEKEFALLAHPPDPPLELGQRLLPRVVAGLTSVTSGSTGQNRRFRWGGGHGGATRTQPHGQLERRLGARHDHEDACR